MSISVTAIDITECSILNTPGETYTLTADISASGNCLDVRADNIIIDGAGLYSITGDGTGFGVRIFNPEVTPPIEEVTVRDLTIINFKDGIFVAGENNLLTNNVITTADGVSMAGINLNVAAVNNVISGNTISAHGQNSNALKVDHASFNEFRDNILSTTGGLNAVVVSVITGSHHNTFINNQISSDCQNCHGFSLNPSNDGWFEDNDINVIGPDSAGVVIDGGSDQNTFVDNEITVTDGDEIVPTPEHTGTYRLLSRPVLDLIDDQSVVEEVELTFFIVEGTELTFIVSSTDADEEVLFYSIEGRPSEATFVDNGDNSATFTWTPTIGQIGNHEITFIVSDGELDDQETITITVTAEEIEPPVTPPINPEEEEYDDLNDDFADLEDDYSAYRTRYRNALNSDDEYNSVRYKNRLQDIRDDLEDLEDDVEDLIDDLEDDEVVDLDLLDNAEELEDEINDLQDKIDDLLDQSVSRILATVVDAGASPVSSAPSPVISVQNVASQSKIVEENGNDTLSLILLCTGIGIALIVIIFMLMILF